MREKILRANSKYQQRVDRLLEELGRYSEEQLQQARAAGAWSAKQTAWHLLLVEETALQYVGKKLSYGGGFKRPGWRSYLRSVWLNLGISVPIKYRAPSNASGERMPEGVRLQDLQARWEAVRREWTVFFENLSDDLIGKAVFKHPVVGRISWLQMLGFMDLHLRRHVKQIRRALRH